MLKSEIRIQVLGSGCPTCRKMFDLVKAVVLEMAIDLEVGYESDVQKILALGLMQSPVLVVDGKAVLIGFTSDVTKIKKAIADNL